MPSRDEQSSLGEKSAAQDLVQELGIRSPVATAAIRSVLDALTRNVSATEFDTWRVGRMPLAPKAERALEQLLTRIAPTDSWKAPGNPVPRNSAEECLFALQCYYANCVIEIACQFSPHARGILQIASITPFWTLESLKGCLDIRNWMNSVRASVAGVFRQTRECLTKLLGQDLLQPLYHDLFSSNVRHALGEYYTPSWLVDHVLDVVHFQASEHPRLLDPSCGSGAFLLAAIRRWRASVEAVSGPSIRGIIRHKTLTRRSRSELLARILASVVGVDLNPLAVLSARANFVIAVSDLVNPAADPIEIPVYLADVLLAPPELGSFSLVTGNPPWIAWDNLSSQYRDATKSLWERYGLFSLTGNQARHGGGKKDLSSLFFYTTADRYLQTSGRIGFIVTQTLFQTAGAGDGFRRFRIGPAGPDLGIYRVDDLVATRPFAGVSNWTCVVAATKGTKTTFPVPYFVWPGKRVFAAQQLARGSNASSLADVARKEFAHPVDSRRPTSPWVIDTPEARERFAENVGPSDYTAHLGANTGGANSVYWLEVLEWRGGMALIQNHVAGAKKSAAQVEAEIETRLIYPLARWSDVSRFRCQPSLFLLLAQDPVTRTGIEEGRMSQEFPNALAYLKRFEVHLRGRAAYRRFQSRAPFYSMYNVGSYSVAPYKVIWRRMDNQMNAVAVGQFETPIGPLSIIPQETCVLIETSCFEEALYLAAVLNSTIVNQRVQSHSVRGGKGFGTPSLLKYLPIRRFDCCNDLHLALAEVGRRAQSEGNARRSVSQQLPKIDELTSRLWNSSMNGE